MGQSRTSDYSSLRRRVGWGKKIAAVSLAGAIGLSLNVASAAENRMKVLTLPGASSIGYTPKQTTLQRGRTLTYVNLDIAQHDVRSNSGLFSSKLIGFGKTTPVNGVKFLAKGKYGFFCSRHPNMRGTLVVR